MQKLSPVILNLKPLSRQSLFIGFLKNNDEYSF
jgi:hypothetical protein